MRNQSLTSPILGLVVMALLILFGSAMIVTAAPTARSTDDTHIPPGIIATDTTWTAAGSPYIVDGNVTVAAGVTLTVEASVVVKTDPYAEIKVQGRLVAIGTAEQPILFTSKTDTGPGQWHGLFFDGGTGDLRHATVRYAGTTNSASIAANIAARNVLTGEVRISDSEISGAQRIDYTDAGLYVQDSHVAVSNTLFTQNGGGGGNDDYPMKISGPRSVVTMTVNSFVGNLNDRVLLYPGAMMGADARLSPQTVLPGYEIYDDFTVPPTVTLTIEPGVTVFNRGELLVQGHLDAIGTAPSPILFTGRSDTATWRWKGLAFDGGSGDLRYTTVRYGAGGANSLGSAADVAARNVLTGEVRISDSIISNVQRSSYTDAGLYVQDSHVAVSNTLFTQNGGGGGNDDYPMKISGPHSVVTMTANSFVGNLNDRVLLYPGAMMGADARLSPQTVLPGYEIYDDFTVPPTVTLTIEPGVTVFNLGELQVQGHLDAIGTTTSPVLFTGRSDTTTWRWKGLFFDGGTGDLRHVTVRYGGSPNSASISGNIVAQNVLAGEVRISDSVVSNAQRSSYTDAGMYVMDSHVTVSNTLFTQNGGGGGNDDAAIKVAGSSVVTMSRASVESNFYGLIIWGGQVAADGVVIEDNLIHGVRIASDSAVFTMTNSTVLLNDGDGVRNESAAQVTLGGAADRGNVILGNGGKGANQVATTAQMLATYNWWGDASGPTHPSNPGGLGEDVSDRVIFSPWLTSTPSLPVPLHTFVRGFAPASASPGEAVNLGVYFTNVATETLRDVVVVAQLPQEAGYLYSTGGGQYWPERHEVVWQLGDVAPGVGFSAVARVQYQWGLAPHSWTGFKALAAASNLANPALDPAEYLGYTPLTVLSEHYLTAEEITGTLSADPDLAARLQEAEAQGFTFYGVAVSRTLSNGATLDLFLTNRDQWREALMVRRASGRSSIFRLAGTTISEANPTGGWRYDDWAGEWSFWGDLDPAHWTLAAGENAGDPIICPDLTREQCYRNCLMESAAAWVSGQKRVGGAFGGVLSLAWKSDSCKECYTWGRYADCQACGLDIGHAMGKTDYFAPCARDCNGLFDDKNKHWCLKNKTKCFRLGWDKYSLTWLCDPATCTYSTQPPIKHSCPEKSICIDGIGCCSQDGTPIYPRATDSVCQAPACPLCQAGVCQRKLIEIRTAGDPNAMYGPEMVTPGELITYTIAYENVGEGTAYGVYIESKLPPELDTSTLQVADGGIYLPSSRLLLWHIGEVGPGAGGQVGFQVRVATGAVSGTIVAANAVVYFPSVPETTPTNDVVSLIQSVAAHPQWVETTEGVPVAVTLSGFSPTGNPLSYQIVDQPLNGTLSGVAPNLLYTPAANFEGLDALTFRVSDGVNQSWPAEVLIVVNTGAETIPPQVVATSPARNERDVPVYATPAYSNTYAPAIWVWFSEPISDTTVTTQTLFIADAQGRRLDNAVLYDATQDAALLMLHEPLVQMATYTVSVTTGVRDTSGNLLAADHVWSFRTVEAVTRIYLPLVMRDH